MWIILYLLAEPISVLYDEPALTELLPIASISIIIEAFSSTSDDLSTRRIEVAKPVRLNLFTQLFALITIIILALAWGNIWAIIIGNLISSFVYTVGSYLYLRGTIVGFQFNSAAAKEFIRLGRWIFISTLLTFLAGQGDRLLVGMLFTRNELGIYNLAVLFSQISLSLLGAVVGRTILPALAEVANNKQNQLYKTFYQMQLLLIISILPVVIISSVFGNYIIEFFYQAPYHSAGWMLQVLSAGMVVQLVCLSVSPILLAKGDSFRHMLSSLAWAIIFIFSMYAGYSIYGQVGLIIGLAIAPIVRLPITLYLIRKYVTVNIKMNLLLIFSAYLLIGIGWWLLGIHIP